MNCEIREDSPATLHEYASIPIAFEVSSVLDVEPANQGLGGLVLSERKLEAPYTKDYDALEDCRPTSWPKQWDISRWRLLAAFSRGKRVGGCAIAYGTEGVLRTPEQKDTAVLWDLRVHPSARREKVGSRLFDAAAAWARAKGFRYLCVETQSINVAACRFYASRGCMLVSVNTLAYAEFPDEAELIWRMALK